MTQEEAKKELEKYSGYPKCQDCGWKLDTDITNNCDCRGELSQLQQELHKMAFEHARSLQRIIHGIPWL